MPLSTELGLQGLASSGTPRTRGGQRDCSRDGFPSPQLRSQGASCSAPAAWQPQSSLSLPTVRAHRRLVHMLGSSQVTCSVLSLERLRACVLHNSYCKTQGGKQDRGFHEFKFLLYPFLCFPKLVQRSHVLLCPQLRLSYSLQHSKSAHISDVTVRDTWPHAPMLNIRTRVTHSCISVH